MKLVTRHPPPLGLEEGTLVDGYVVGSLPARHGKRELICDAVGPDGEAVSLVMALSPPVGRRGWARFRRSARARADLHHSALLPVRAVGAHSGRPYLAMDAYPEETFADLVNQSALAPEEVVTLLAPVCDALDLAHANGLVHQSLSSTSILVDHRGTLLLDGFGVVRGPQDMTVAAIPDVHDVSYSPPEQLYGKQLTPASNVYSVACLLVESLTAGRRRGRMPARAYLHLMEPSEALSASSPGLSPAFDKVIRKGMALHRRDRPASARDLLSEAAAALGVGVPGPAVDPPHESTVSHGASAARGARRRHNAFAPVVATTIVALVAGVGAGALVRPFDGASSSAAGPSADARALEHLDDQRALRRARLSGGDTPQEQAASAAALADAYGRLADVAESPRLASAARAAEGAYEDLGAAAGAGSAEQFAAASDGVMRADARLASIAAGSR